MSGRVERLRRGHGWLIELKSVTASALGHPETSPIKKDRSRIGAKYDHCSLARSLVWLSFQALVVGRSTIFQDRTYPTEAGVEA